MIRIVLALALLFALAAHASGEQHPGYGVVETMTPLKGKSETSASAGASAPARRESTRFLVKVRMDDGTIQVREMRKSRGIRVGSRVLLTNAGDVLPD